MKVNKTELKSIIKECVVSFIKENAYTKKKYMRKIYKVTTDLTSHLFHDDSWQGVTEMLARIKSLPFVNDIDVRVEDGGYRRNTGNGISNFAVGDGAKWKEYLITIFVTSEEGEEITINGHINCHAAGSVEDPFDRYDMTIVLY